MFVEDQGQNYFLHDWRERKEREGEREWRRKRERK